MYCTSRQLHILSFSPIVDEELEAAKRYCKNFRNMTHLHDDFLRPLLCQMFPKERVDAYYVCISRGKGGKYPKKSYLSKTIFFQKKKKILSKKKILPKKIFFYKKYLKKLSLLSISFIFFIALVLIIIICR
jgi:hypothetical protein